MNLLYELDSLLLYLYVSFLLICKLCKSHYCSKLCNVN